jgi:hypothetical protein
MERCRPDGVISPSSHITAGERLEYPRRPDPIPLLEGGSESWTKFCSELSMVWI